MVELYEVLAVGACAVLTGATVLNYISLRRSEKNLEEFQKTIVAMAERNDKKERNIEKNEKEIEPRAK